MWTTSTLLLSCSFHAPTLLLLYSSPAPASALPLPYSCPAPFKLLSSTFLAPPQFLPSSPLSALFCFTQLMLQPRSCFAPALPLPCSWSCQHQFGSLHHLHHQHLTTFFGTARAAFYGTRKKSKPKKGCRLASVLQFFKQSRLPHRPLWTSGY